MPLPRQASPPILLVAFDAPRGPWLGALQGAHPATELQLDPLDHIDAATLAENFVARGLVRKAKELGGRLHLIGLLSDAGLQSSWSHLCALIDLAAAAGVRVVVHALLDGVDVPVGSAKEYLEQLEAKLDGGVGRIGTVSGRGFGMDTEQRWDRIDKVYRAMMADGVSRADSALEGVRQACQFGVPEAFLEPFIAFDYPGVSLVDTAIHLNFASDGARELCHALAASDFPHFVRRAGKAPFEGRFASMVPVDDSLPSPTLFPRAPDPLAIAMDELEEAGVALAHGGQGTASQVADATLAALRAGTQPLVVADFGDPGNPARTPPGAERQAALVRLLDEARPMGCDIFVLGGRDAHNRVPLIDASPHAASLREGGRLADLAATLLQRLRVSTPTEATGTSLGSA